MKGLFPAAWKTWTNAALSFVYPEVCQLCERERATVERSFVCDACRAEVKLIRPPWCSKCGRPFEGSLTVEFVCDHCRQSDLHFCWARSAAAASGPVLDAIHKYKYNRQLWFEGFLADLLVAAAAESLATDRWDAIVPVPLFPVKQREREFNQAERLGRPLSVAAGIPMATRVIKRVLPTQSQTRLSRTERADNMRGAFALHRGERCTGRSYILIDDVFTTGATTDACAKVLLKAGAARVGVWTVARGI